MPDPFGWFRQKKAQGPKERPAIVIGLGNPGEKYAGTRHNVGFRCLDLVGQRAGMTLNDRRKQADLGQGRLASESVVLAKPRTFMNHSGIAARYLVDRFGTKPDRVLVVLDDMDLPLGKVRLKASGGSGGHNGLNSINAELGTSDYPRLRIGIGRPKGNVIRHVLDAFSAEDEQTLAEALEAAAQVVETWVEHGVDHAMNEFN
jgi:PTH1 family peptidyl-tRNA hydrolase